MSHIAIACRTLSKRFGAMLAVHNVDLSVKQGAILAVLGPSGSGKTTLLRLIAGFEVPDGGIIQVGERPVVGPGVWVPPEERRVGMVFQEYALFPHMDVLSNVAYGLPRGDASRQRAREILSLVGLAGMESRMPHQLSGGEQQRVALARALAPQPEVLLLDEPLSNLDASLRSQVRAEVKQILRRAGTTAVFVTHDQEEAIFMGDQVAVMNGGRIEQVDTPEGIFHQPATSFVAHFMGTADFLAGRINGGWLQTDGGSIPVPSDVPDGTAVELMVRPDDVTFEMNPQSNGVITDRAFRGMHYLYWVTLASGAQVRVLRHHTERYPVGTPVRLLVAPGHSLVCFAGGKVLRTGEMPLAEDGHR